MCIRDRSGVERRFGGFGCSEGGFIAGDEALGVFFAFFTGVEGPGVTAGVGATAGTGATSGRSVYKYFSGCARLSFKYPGSSGLKTRSGTFARVGATGVRKIAATTAVETMVVCGR